MFYRLFCIWDTKTFRPEFAPPPINNAILILASSLAYVWFYTKTSNCADKAFHHICKILPDLFSAKRSVIEAYSAQKLLCPCFEVYSSFKPVASRRPVVLNTMVKFPAHIIASQIHAKNGQQMQKPAKQQPLVGAKSVSLSVHNFLSLCKTLYCCGSKKPDFIITFISK